MKNVRLDGDDLIYDCGGNDCEQPGVPHRVSLRRIMASLEASLDEFYHNKDPRVEEILTLMIFMWETQFELGIHGDQIPDQAPWDTELDTLKHKLFKLYHHHHDHDHSHNHDKKPDKDYLN